MGLLSAVPAAATPGDAADKRAAAARKLDALEATDDELADAADTLDSALGAAVRRAGDARRAADEADLKAEVAAETLQSVQRVISERAVAAYTASGPRGGVPDLSGVTDPNAAVRRLVLQRFVDARLTDAVDDLRATQQDLVARKAAAKAKAKAASSALTEVTKARSHAVKARADLADRIKEVQSEVDALDGEEAAVVRILAARPPTPPRAATASAAPGASASGYAWPLAGGRTTSEFGYRWGRMHKGIDVAAPTGTPLLASRAGTVAFAGWQGGYGNLTLVDHGGGIVTAYGHQSRLGAPTGAEVERGSVIGFVGSTGHSTGPHVHFEVRVNGAQQNPRGYLPPR